MGKRHWSIVIYYLLRAFLYTGVMLPFFHSSGETPCWREFLYIIDRGLVIVQLHKFTIRIEIPSWPWALCGFEPLINIKIFPQSISKSLSLFWVQNIWFLGRMLLLAIGWHCCTKKSLKMLAFSLNLEIWYYWPIILG